MSPSAALRLFVAAYPPPEAAETMLRALRALELARHREVPPTQVHMTLQFIGDRAPSELDAVAESVERSCAGIAAFSLKALTLTTLPERGHARLVAAETDAPAPLLELHRRLAHRLAREPRRNPADRFLPHMTVCRFAHGERQPRLRAAIEAPPFRVERAVLMRSILRPGGAEHAEVASFPLEG